MHLGRRRRARPRGRSMRRSHRGKRCVRASLRRSTANCANVAFRRRGDAVIVRSSPGEVSDGQDHALKRRVHGCDAIDRSNQGFGASHAASIDQQQPGMSRIESGELAEIRAIPRDDDPSRRNRAIEDTTIGSAGAECADRRFYVVPRGLEQSDESSIARVLIEQQAHDA